VCDRVNPTVPKKTKPEQTNAVAQDEPVTSAAAPAEVAPEPKKPAAKKTAAKKATPAKAAAKKASAKKSTKKASAKTSAPAKRGMHPTDEEIRIRAYFIAERRLQMRMEGDPGNDWIQAREELIAELGENKPNGNGTH
jgi:outer membrane biosynthesis protein TonB